MTCHAVSLPGGMSAIVCGRMPVKRCNCGTPAQFLCDHDTGRGRTCSRPLCFRCTTKAGTDKDLCPLHAFAPAQAELFT